MLDRLLADKIIVGKRRTRMWLPERTPHALDRWLFGYGDVVRPKMARRSYRTADRDPEALWREIETLLGDEREWRWSGTVAAFRLTGFYRGEISTVLLDAALPPRFAEQLRALPSDDGNLLVMEPFGTLTMRGTTPDTAHPLLVYSEMLAEGTERAREAAEEFRVRYLEI